MPKYFDEYFGSINGCVDYLKQQFDTYYDDYVEMYGRTCAQAQRSWWSCYYLDSIQCTSQGLDYGYGDCATEYDDFQKACASSGYGDAGVIQPADVGLGADAY